MVNDQLSIINAKEPTHFESLYPPETRQNEIEKILSFVKSGNSAQLIGMPGSGRSSILGLLAFNKNVRLKHLGENQKWFHFVPLDFSEIRNRPLTDAMKFIFLGIIDSLRERNLEAECEKVNQIFTKALSVQDEMVFFQGLKRALDFLSIEKELTVILLFDRFEEYIPMLTSSFFANLRILRNHAKYRFSVVFSLNRPLDQLVEPVMFADFYEFIAGKEVYVSLFDKPGFDFRLQYMEKVNNQTLEEKVVDQVLELTGGHGKLTRVCLEAVMATPVRHSRESGNPEKWIPDQVGDDKSDSGQARMTDVSLFLLTQQPVLGSLYEIWLYLTPSEQHVFSSSIPSPFGRGQGEGETSTTFLQHIHLLHNGKLQIPLLETFIQTHVNNETMKQSSNQFTYNPNTHEIRRGDQTFSDKLTGLEFKLLRFLVTNPDRMIERDEIITFVWGENASTAGVTDQALDQLIFRLRKKIEDDPNNPYHLQTVKGRGFRFIQ